MGNPRGFLKTGREDALYRDPASRIKDYDELPEALGEEKLKNQSSRCMDCGVPFCMSGCPLGNFIPDFNDYVYNGLWEEAIRTLYATNNFPEVTGRICPAPCESSCVLGITDPPVTIKQMEQAISAKAEKWGLMGPSAISASTGKRVAIVGSGPSGMACAQQLARAGHAVKVFEKAPYGGGLLTFGIPPYKLPKDLVQKRLSLLQEEGVEFVYNTQVGKDIPYEALVEEYDALVLCIGAERPRPLEVPGADGKGIYYAMEYLPQKPLDILGLSKEAPPISAEGKNVIVIGGGDTGADCIGTSLREGAKSVLNLELMPKGPLKRAKTNPWPMYDKSYKPSTSAVENSVHGGRVLFNVLTESVELDGNGHVKRLHTKRVAFSEEGSLGAGKMQVLPSSEESFDCDLLLLAMGYLGPYTEKVKESLGLRVDDRGRLFGKEKEGVFVAGDCRRGQSLVVYAIAEGREMAARVDEYLMGRPTALSRCLL